MDLPDLVDGPLPDVLLEHVPAFVVQEDAPIDAPLPVELSDADDASMQVDGETDVDIDMASSSSLASVGSLSCVESDREGSSCISDPLALPVVEVISRGRSQLQSAKIATAKFFGNRALVQVQAQVLLVNAVDMAMRIPKALLSRAFRYVSAAHPKGNIVYAFIAKLVGLGASQVGVVMAWSWAKGVGSGLVMARWGLVMAW